MPETPDTVRDVPDQRSPTGRRPPFPVELRNETVAYPDRPDRCTVYPPATEGVARLSTWLSVDRSAMVDLARMR